MGNGRRLRKHHRRELAGAGRQHRIQAFKRVLFPVSAMTLRRGDGPAPIRTPARRSSFFPTFFLLLSLIACRKEAAAPIPSPAVSSEAPPAPDAASEEVPARELLITEKAFIR